MNKLVPPIDPFALKADPKQDLRLLRAQNFPAAPVKDPDEAIRVVVVDDEPIILGLIEETLKPPLFETTTANTAFDFIDSVKTINPHVVLIDLRLPGSDGIDVLGLLRDISYAGEVVLMSGADLHLLETARRMATAFRLNVVGILQKPFSMEQLVAAADRSAGASISDARVRTALNTREIRPYFQPKIRLGTGEIVGAEALSRWHHPERGLLLPNGYLKNIQASGGQGLHDYSILEGAMELCAQLNQMGLHIKFAVNFTAEVVLSAEFLDVVMDAIHRYSVSPDQLVVELTENDAVDNTDALIERLLKLRLLGPHLSIDDFGIGRSSLSRVQKLPINELKIDRSFIEGLMEYSDDYAIVRSIVDLAHNIHCEVVAEGVETIDTLTALHKIGCDMAQGHIFSPAVNRTTFLALIKNKTPILPSLSEGEEGDRG